MITRWNITDYKGGELDANATEVADYLERITTCNHYFRFRDTPGTWRYREGAPYEDRRDNQQKMFEHLANGEAVTFYHQDPDRLRDIPEKENVVCVIRPQFQKSDTYGLCPKMVMTKEAVAECIDEIAATLDAVGDCDHSTGICYCATRDLLESLTAKLPDWRVWLPSCRKMSNRYL